MSTLEKALGETMKSSTLTVCTKCGSTATYVGSPKEINDAAERFYELHQRCWEQRQQSGERKYQ